MSNLWFRTGAGRLCLAAVLGLLSYSPSLATDIVCGERGSSSRLVRASDNELTISVSRSDLVTWNKIAGKDTVHFDYGSGYQFTQAPGSFTVTAGVTVVKIKPRGKNSVISVSCQAAASITTAAGTGASVGDLGANSQIFSTSTGIGLNTKSRLGLGSNLVTKDAVFMSTSNLRSSRFLPPDWNAWATLEGRAYSGGLGGSSVDLVAGIDRLVTPGLLVGLLGGVGQTQVTDTGTPETVNSPMIGAYFGSRSNTGVTVDGFLSFAQPQYDVSGANFSSERRSAGLTVSGRINGQKLAWEPFLFARGYAESLPGYTMGGGGVVAASETTSFAASLGVKVAFEGGKADRTITPYISGAADYRMTSSTLGSSDRILAPRIGFGVFGKLGAGDFSIDIDIGRARSDTVDHGVKLGYEMKF